MRRYLSNLEDLLGGGFGGGRSLDTDACPVSPRLAALRAEPFGSYDADGSLAAELVLALYHSHTGSSDVLIMLSQLQVPSRSVQGLSRIGRVGHTG